MGPSAIESAINLKKSTFYGDPNSPGFSPSIVTFDRGKRMYSITKREKATGKFFYVRFKDSKSGKYGNAKSIDTLAAQVGFYKTHITKIPEAHAVVRLAIEKGLDGTTQRNDPLFVQFCLDFWDWESDFIQTEIKLNPGSLNKDYCRNSQRNIENWVKGNVPADLRCSKVSTEHIESIQRAVLAKCSGQTWRNVMNSLRRPLTELRRRRILLTDPLFDLRAVKARNKTVSTVGALTRRETDLLLFQMYKDSTEGRDIEIEGKSRTGNAFTYPKHFILDKRVYLATALSAVSGMRIGEVQALDACNIRFPNSQDNAEDMAIIDVCQNYAREAGIKSTKSGKPRQVVIPRWLADELVSFAKTNPWDNGLVFYSDTNRDKPFVHSSIDKWFRFELDFVFGSQAVAQGRKATTDSDNDSGPFNELMKLGEKERKDRNIHFHSLRHYFDTQALNSIGGEMTRNLMGHESEAMTQTYFNVTDEMLLSAGKTTTLFITNPKVREA